jgi:hypothetical protein
VEVTENAVKVVRQGRIVADVGGGLRGPKTVDVVALHPDLEGVKIEARIVPIEGTYEVVDVRLRTAGDHPLPPEALRRIPLRSIVRIALTPLLRRLNEDKIAYVADPEHRSEEVTRLGLSAHVYRLARLTGEPPTEAVRKALSMPGISVSKATASRIVKEMRDKNYLREDEVGHHAGGAPSRLGG